MPKLLGKITQQNPKHLGTERPPETARQVKAGRAAGLTRYLGKSEPYQRYAPTRGDFL